MKSEELAAQLIKDKIKLKEYILKKRDTTKKILNLNQADEGRRSIGLINVRTGTKKSN